MYTEFRKLGKDLLSDVTSKELTSEVNMRLLALHPEANELPPLFHAVSVVPNEQARRKMDDAVNDWWPTNKMEHRCSIIEQYGVPGINWKLGIGIQDTLKWLAVCEEDRDMQAWIWMMAAIWQLNADSSRGGVRRVHPVVKDWFEENCPQETPWHHAVQHTTPIDADILVPDGLYEQNDRAYLPALGIAHLAAILAFICTTTWKLVHVKKVERRIELVG